MSLKKVTFANIDTLTRYLRAEASRRKKSVLSILDKFPPEVLEGLNHLAEKSTAICKEDVEKVVKQGRLQD